MVIIGSPFSQEAASQIIKKIGSNSSKTDGIYPMALFIDEVAKILNTHQLLTDTDSQILLKYLSRDRSVIIHDAQVSFIYCLLRLCSEIWSRLSNL